MPEPTKAQLLAEVTALREALKRETAARQRLEDELASAERIAADSVDQQTATSDILRVISSSSADVQPAFEAICQSAVRLFAAYSGAIVLRSDGDMMHLGAVVSPRAEADERYRVLFPRPLDREFATGRAILERKVVHVPDTERDTAERNRNLGRDFGYRRALVAPMMRDGEAIGALAVTGGEPGRYSDRQIALLKTFADQAVIAIENVRLFNETKEALDRQTATAEILRVISQSPTDIQPVFDTIVNNAVRLCGATHGGVYRFDGELVHSVAHAGFTPEQEAAWRKTWPRPASAASLACQAIRTNAVVRVGDMEIAADLRDLTPETRAQLRARGSRSFLAVPIRRREELIGAISLGHPQVDGFSVAHEALLMTFADQAVIAIENVRLFTELQASNRDLTTALDKQTATSDILRVISGSRTDVQPVFDAIVQSAVRLLHGYSSVLTRIAGDQIELAALTSTDEAGDAAARASYPRSLQSQHGTHGQAIRDRAPINVADAHTAYARVRGFRSQLTVPMLRRDEPLGTISVSRREPGAFTDDEVALLQTFADQAVIAIENARLLSELQASNRNLTEALEQQTATSEILRVISSSPTRVQPVFDAIIESAVRLCHGNFGVVYRYDGQLIHLVAHHNIGAEALEHLRRRSPRPPGKAVLERRIVQVADFETDPDVPDEERLGARLRGSRSNVTVPMMRDGDCLGTIVVGKRTPGGFPDAQVALLKTFADQAVIAIENLRLFTALETRTQELTRSVGELQALGEVGQAISSTLDLQTVLSTIVARATQLANADAGVIYEYDEPREVFEPRATERLEDHIVQALVATPVRKGQGATGRLAEVRQPTQLADVRAGGEQMPVRDVLIHAGYRALLAVPLVREDHLIGGLTVFRKTPGEFPAEIVDLLKTFATQSSLAIQNARLFREIAQKSRELEVASQHKSEFLASMSHELRTPLNAVIGFSEVLRERMFGEVNDKQAEYLNDIHASAEHLLSLINDILDLSKIEAGRMDLDVAAFDLPTAIDDALLLMHERASRRGITLERHVDGRLGEIHADQRKLKQVLLNLLSNAIKFTPEGGRIDVRAKLADGTVEISVTDTGIGIAPEDHDAVFEEFRQVGKADKKAEGTGLGLALCRKFVELHGGRIWLTSTVGKGSTFSFTIPVLRDLT